MKTFWFLFIPFPLFVRPSAVPPHSDNDFDGIGYFIIATVTRSRVVKYNYQICQLFACFKNIRILLKNSPSHNILAKVLWRIEKRVEKEFRTFSRERFILSLHMNSRGVLPRNTEYPQVSNSTGTSLINFPASLAELIGLSARMMFNLNFLKKLFPPSICFYIVLAVAEWQKVYACLFAVDPVVGKLFLENFTDDIFIDGKLELIKQLLDLMLCQTCDNDGQLQNRYKLIFDHVYSFSNIVFIFHLLEYVRHFTQIKELLLMSDASFGNKVFTLSEWEALNGLYIILMSMSLSPNTIVIARKRVSELIRLNFADGVLRINPTGNSGVTINELRFEQVYTRATKGNIRSAGYREENGEIILAIYNSTHRGDLELFAVKFLDKLIDQLKKGPVPLTWLNHDE